MFNDMTISLLIIGALIIGFTLAYNRWQARRLHKHNEAQAVENRDLENQPEFDAIDDTDVDISNARTLSETDIAIQDSSFFDEDEVEFSAEASFDQASSDDHLITFESSTESNNKVADDVLENINQPLQSMDEPQPVTSISSKSSHDLPVEVSEDIDTIVQFELTSDDGKKMNLQSVIEQLFPPAGLQSLLQIYAQNTAGEWQHSSLIKADISYQRMLLGLQLVSRDGAISEQDVQQFSQLVEYLQNQLSSSPKWISNSNVLEKARELDQFCILVDKTVRLHLLHGVSGRFTGTKFRGLAEANHLQIQDGKYVFLSENNQILFTLENIERNPFNQDMLRTVVLKGVTFQLDIPRTADCAEVFDVMLDIAKKMETALGGVLVDEQQRELSELHLEKINQQIKLIQDQMNARGIPSGCDTALRLFR